MSVRKSSHGTIFLIVSSGSPRAANRLQPALNIEKALLPHDPLAPSAHDRVRSPSQIRGDLARGIFRGAHMSQLHFYFSGPSALDNPGSFPSIMIWPSAATSNQIGRAS